MRVRATAPCYVKYYREIGDEFEILPEQFNESCMEKIDEEAEVSRKSKRAKKEDSVSVSKIDEDVI